MCQPTILQSDTSTRCLPDPACHNRPLAPISFGFRMSRQCETLRDLRAESGSNRASIQRTLIGLVIQGCSMYRKDTTLAMTITAVAMHSEPVSYRSKSSGDHSPSSSHNGSFNWKEGSCVRGLSRRFAWASILDHFPPSEGLLYRGNIFVLVIVWMLFDGSSSPCEPAAMRWTRRLFCPS